MNQAVFDLLGKKVAGDKLKLSRPSRPGGDLWHILALGVVRLCLDCDYDRIEHMAHYDSPVRQIMGLPVFGVGIILSLSFDKGFSRIGDRE